MKAIVVRPGEQNSIQMRDMPDPNMSDDHGAVKMLRVGLCGTDAEIDHGLYGKPPDGEEFLGEMPEPRSVNHLLWSCHGMRVVSRILVRSADL